MKAPFFEFPSFQYQIKDWDFKKKSLIKRIKEEKFVRTALQTFETDRQTNNKSYLHFFQNLIHDELSEFCQEAQITCGMTDCWTVRYQKGDQQTIHNHRSWGFSGILYIDFDPKVHTPTLFCSTMARSKIRYYISFISQECKRRNNDYHSIIYFAFAVHPNLVRKPRTIMSFDLLPKTTKSSINKYTSR